MILTKQLLDDIGACEDGIMFCKRNKLFGFDLNNIHLIKDNNNEYFLWLQDIISNVNIQYDENNRILCKSYVDNNSDIVKQYYTYNEDGLVVSINYSNGNYENYLYDCNNNLVEESYSSHHFNEVYRYQYDEYNNKVKTTNARGFWETYSYEDGKLKKVLNSNGCTTCYTYNKNGVLRTKERTILSKWERQTYNKYGNVICDERSDGFKIRYRYNKNQQCIYRKSYKDNISVIFSYEDGNLVLSKDSTGYLCTWELDSHNNMVHFKDSNNFETIHEFEYYSDGQLKRMDDLIIPFFNK